MAKRKIFGLLVLWALVPVCIHAQTSCYSLTRAVDPVDRLIDPNCTDGYNGSNGYLDGSDGGTYTSLASLGINGKKGMGVSIAHGSIGTAKRDNKAFMLDIAQQLNLNWNYSWNNRFFDEYVDLERYSPHSKYLPMVFRGDQSVADFQKMIDTAIIPLIESGQYTAIMGFNEPDASTQGNTTVEEALEKWEILETLGVPLIGPSATSAEYYEGNEPTAKRLWMRRFYDSLACRNRLPDGTQGDWHTAPGRLDFIGVHIYSSPNACNVKKKLYRIHNDYPDIPLVITEFAVAQYSPSLKERSLDPNNPDPYSRAEVLDYMKEILPFMENTNWIAGYAWFPFEIFDGYAASSSSLFFPDGTLTRLGQYYASVSSADPDGDQTITDIDDVHPPFDPPLDDAYSFDNKLDDDYREDGLRLHNTDGDITDSQLGTQRNAGHANPAIVDREFDASSYVTFSPTVSISPDAPDPTKLTGYLTFACNSAKDPTGKMNLFINGEYVSSVTVYKSESGFQGYTFPFVEIPANLASITIAPDACNPVNGRIRDIRFKYCVLPTTRVSRTRILDYDDIPDTLFTSYKGDMFATNITADKWLSISSVPTGNSFVQKDTVVYINGGKYIRFSPTILAPSGCNGSMLDSDSLEGDISFSFHSFGGDASRSLQLWVNDQLEATVNMDPATNGSYHTYTFSGVKIPASADSITLTSPVGGAYGRLSYLLFTYTGIHSDPVSPGNPPPAVLGTLNSDNIPDTLFTNAGGDVTATNIDYESRSEVSADVTTRNSSVQKDTVIYMRRPRFMEFEPSISVEGLVTDTDNDTLVVDITFDFLNLSTDPDPEDDLIDIQVDNLPVQRMKPAIGSGYLSNTFTDVKIPENAQTIRLSTQSNSNEGTRGRISYLLFTKKGVIDGTAGGARYAMPDESDENANRAILLYPNPVQHGEAKVTVALSQQAEGSYINVTDLLGHILLSRPMLKPSITLDISELSPGLYVVSVRSDSGLTSERLLIKE